ncbi:MAG: NifU family protein [Holophagales bacterium]|jgi:Fe-S cluster biogenesis protein NfuA|nr:NifU family protein [Holophagales bacterium]
MPKIANIEPTPNPNALKFVVKEPLITKTARSFQDFASAVGDPLGSAIFALGSVTSVFYMDRFVTVNKLQTADWTDLIDPICDVIEDCKIENVATNFENSAPLETDDMLQKIIDVVNNRIRPGLAGDGGGLDVISFDGKTLTIAYQGACGSCPAAGTGTLQFIEGLLQHEVDPSIKVVMS